MDRKATQHLFSLREVLGERTPKIDILDIGAMLEGEERYAPLRRANVARVTAVEPNEEQAGRLRETNPDIRRLLPYVLGDGFPATMHITRYPGCSSLYEPDPAVIDRFTSISTLAEDGNFRVQRTEEVPTRRLDDVDPIVDADYIKIDVQGAELDVLRHAVRTLSRTCIVESEVEFVPIYKKQPLFGDVQTFMREQGFVLHKLIDVGSRSFRPFDFQGNRFAGTSQLLWADAVFVRDFSDLAGYSTDQLVKAAMILHDVYRSYDLAFLLLNEDDVRTGSGSVRRYAERLLAIPDRPRWLLNLKERGI